MRFTIEWTCLRMNLGALFLPPRWTWKPRFRNSSVRCLVRRGAMPTWALWLCTSGDVKNWRFQRHFDHICLWSGKSMDKVSNPNFTLVNREIGIIGNHNQQLFPHASFNRNAQLFSLLDGILTILTYWTKKHHFWNRRLYPTKRRLYPTTFVLTFL